MYFSIYKFVKTIFVFCFFFYRFHGAVVHPNGGRVPVTIDNLLLRECLLKNTDFIEGIVVYAGHETKAMLNNGGPRHKVNIKSNKINDIMNRLLT